MRVFRLIAVFALVLALGVVQASALPAREGAGRRQVENHTHSVFSLVGDIFVTLWNKAGCTIDPLGGCVPSVPETKEGCRIDPWGRCSSSTAPATDAGCGIDPWGRCG